MALLRDFVKIHKNQNRVHDTVECGWTVFEKDGQTYLQLDTYGSSMRQIPGKISQSIQLDAQAAGELVGLIHSAFPASRG